MLRGVPADAWNYKLGNRCAMEWVLDQYKERKSEDPTIREKFDTYRFADYKEKVIDLLKRGHSERGNDAYNKGDEAGGTMITGRIGVDAIAAIEFRG